MLNMRKKEISVILREIAKIKDTEERKTTLRWACQNNGALPKILQLIYHEDFKLDLPEGEVPQSIWNPSNHDEYGILYNIITRRKLWNLVPRSNVAKVQKEKLFVDALETVTKNDSEVVLAVKYKKLPYKGLDEKFVKESLPELFK
jgi:hypothetical protein